jgi:hypothetical protein
MEWAKRAWRKILLSYCNLSEEENRPKPENYNRGLEGGSMGSVSTLILPTRLPLAVCEKTILVG